MTAINLDDQVVVTRYDRAARTCHYTYQHTDGTRYTVVVPLDDLQKLGTTPANRDVRRRFLAQRILSHIQTSPPDKVDNGSTSA